MMIWAWIFPDAVIAQVNKLNHGVVFMLWGAHAQGKLDMINRQKHYVLTAPLPSPLSAHRGFLGCEHFSKANKFLKQNGQQVIDWSDL